MPAGSCVIRKRPSERLRTIAHEKQGKRGCASRTEAKPYRQLSIQVHTAKLSGPASGAALMIG